MQQQTGAPPSAPAPAGRKQDKRDPVDDAVVRVAVDLVQVDVVVTDQKGQHVTNLNAEDFEVFEEGRKQEVRNFSYVSTDGSAEPGDNGRSTSTSTPSTRPLNSSTDVTNSRRTIALVVDDLGISFESMVSVREALRKFVAQQMLPTDQVAIITTSKRIGALEQFTSDKRQLQRTIDNIQFYPGGHAGLSPFEQPQQQLADPTEVPELASKSAQTINDLEAERAANYTVGTFGTLNFVMQGLGQMPGRKTVMLFAESFRLFTNQGRNARLFENLQRLTEQANLASTVIYTTDASGLNPLSMTASDKVLGLSYTFDPRTVGDFRTGSARSIRSAAAPSLREIARQEGGSSAAFKDLEELMNLRDTQNIESQTVLSYLAQQTGGLFTRNTNNLTLGTERMLDDQKGFYLIGYRPHESVIDPATGRRRYRDLTVKLKRSSLRLRSRDGYYGVTREEARKTRRTREEQIGRCADFTLCRRWYGYANDAALL
ncbi:MAG: VWA domain-containing protein [Pyrinomonadaceae bacterium]